MSILCIGLTVFGLGEALLIAAGAGVSLWTVLAQGISTISGWSIGITTFLTSIAILLAGLGSGLYLIANLGPGPRDGLMTGLQRVTDWPVARVRTAIEMAVVLFGWLLGGTVGIGTLMFAFGIGPAVSLGLTIVSHFSTKSA